MRFYSKMKDDAFLWLERLREERNEWLTWLDIAPELDSLRADKRFADLLRRVRHAHCPTPTE